MPTWKELRRYLDRSGWILYRQTDHYHYMKELENGDVLKTKVSKGGGEIRYELWQYIMKHQLHITQEEFNRMK